MAQHENRLARKKHQDRHEYHASQQLGNASLLIHISVFVGLKNSPMSSQIEVHMTQIL